MNSVFAALPQLEISQVEKTGSVMKCSGRVKNTAIFAKARPGWIVVICVEENKFVAGKFSAVNSQTFQVVIDISELKSPNLVVGKDYPLLAGYWGNLAELVLDESAIWKRIKFEPHDITARNPDGSIKIVKDGWDHEHCRICFQNISTFEVNNQYGYVNQKDDWLCESCYQKYVEEKSLGFINLDQMF